jgi:hypothetical protein
LTPHRSGCYEERVLSGDFRPLAGGSGSAEAGNPIVIQRWLAFAFAVFCAAAVPGAAQAGPVRVAILPVVVNASEGHDYLRAGMADMLASRIGREEGVAVTRIADVAKATTDAARAREVGREVGADLVLYGSFTAFGAGASLDLACTLTAPPQGSDDDEIPVRAIFIQSGTLGDIIPKLDTVAQRIARFAATGEMAPVAAAPVAAAGGNGTSHAQYDQLLQRIEALEKNVMDRGTAPVAAPPAAPVAPPAEPPAPSATPNDGVEFQDLRRGELREDPDPGAFDPDRSVVR